MISNRTLGDCVANGYKLIGNCTHQYCGRGRYLDMDALVEHFGADYVVIGESRIGAAFKCGRVDDAGRPRRGGTIAVEPCSKPVNENPYLKARGE